MFCSVVSAVEELADVDLHGLSDADLCDAVVEMEQLAAMVDAQRARLVGAWDARKAWRPSGAKSGAAWLTTTCRIPHQEARRQLRLGRAVRELPIASAAWQAGEITAFHVLRLLRARNPRTSFAMTRDEQRLVELARSETYAEFDRAVAYWLDIVDPDGCDASAEERRTRRGMHLSESIDGMWFGNIVLDPVTGAIVGNELRRLETILFEADRADAKQRLGIENPTVADLARTPQQRRADALALMAERSATAPADGKKPAPLFTVLVGYETFAGRICQLASNSPVAPGSLLPYLNDAVIERVVFDAPGHVVEVSQQRTFTGLLRRAVQVRDRECYHPKCDLPADFSQVDHIHPDALGGPTTQTNGRLACGHHNRLRNNPTPTPGPEPP